MRASEWSNVHLLEEVFRAFAARAESGVMQANP